MTLSQTERVNMIENNMSLVTSRVMKLNNGIYDDDLFQEGCVALTLAVDRFDPAKKNKFSTFAVKYVDGYIMTAKNKDHVIRPARGIRDGKHGYQKRHAVDSFETPINEDGATLQETLSCEPLANIVDDIAVSIFFDSLNKRQRDVVEMRMAGYKQQEISDEVGISQVHVHRILKQVGEIYAKKHM